MYLIALAGVIAATAAGSCARLCRFACRRTCRRSRRISPGIHRVVVSLLEYHIFNQTDGGNVLLLNLALVVLLLTYHHALSFGLEQHTAGRDGRCGAIFGPGHADTGKANLENSDALELDLLSHLEEVLHSLAQFLQHGLDIALLYRCLSLDEVGNLVGAHKVIVVNGRSIVLAVCLVERVVVL